MGRAIEHRVPLFHRTPGASISRQAPSAARQSAAQCTKSRVQADTERSSGPSLIRRRRCWPCSSSAGSAHVHPIAGSCGRWPGSSVENGLNAGWRNASAIAGRGDSECATAPSDQREGSANLVNSAHGWPGTARPHAERRGAGVWAGRWALSGRDRRPGRDAYARRSVDWGYQRRPVMLVRRRSRRCRFGHAGRATDARNNPCAGAGEERVRQ